MRNALDLLFFGIFCFGLRAGNEFEIIILWGFKGQTVVRHSKAKEISFFDSVTIQNGRKCALLFTVKATNESGHTEPGDKVFFFF